MDGDFASSTGLYAASRKLAMETLTGLTRAAAFVTFALVMVYVDFCFCSLSPPCGALVAPKGCRLPFGVEEGPGILGAD